MQKALEADPQYQKKLERKKRKEEEERKKALAAAKKKSGGRRASFLSQDEQLPVTLDGDSLVCRMVAQVARTHLL